MKLFFLQSDNVVSFIDQQAIIMLVLILEEESLVHRLGERFSKTKKLKDIQGNQAEVNIATNGEFYSVAGFWGQKYDIEFGCDAGHNLKASFLLDKSSSFASA